MGLLLRFKDLGLATYTVHQEGTRVQLIRNGKLIADMEWELAADIAKFIKLKALLAEEFAKRDQVVKDQALLLRAGAPFGVTNNPALQKEAAKEAAWDRDLRRALPGGVKSTEMVGIPTLIQHEPKEN